MVMDKDISGKVLQGDTETLGLAYKELGEGGRAVCTIWLPFVCFFFSVFVTKGSKYWAGP